MTKLAELTQEQKNEISYLITEAIGILGSASAVARRCDVSDATISLMAKGQYETKGDKMWLKVAAALGWRESGWLIADTTNVRLATQALRDAQTSALFLRICENAGSGKSASITKFKESNTTNNVFHLTCREWTKRQFLLALANVLGRSIPPHVSLDEILETVIRFFKTRKGRPVLVLDQANSLKPHVLSYLIHLHNETEDHLGVVLCGTRQMEYDFKRGLKNNWRGYDELDSRFGRGWVHLVGNTLSDVRKICQCNGITDKDIQEEIFRTCGPVDADVQTGNGESQKVKVIKDTRVIKRAIQRHHLLNAVKE